MKNIRSKATNKDVRSPSEKSQGDDTQTHALTGQLNTANGQNKVNKEKTPEAIKTLSYIQG